MHTVKCGRFHSATEALVTAYSKEISNKVAEKHKNTRYEEPFSIESLKESASKVWLDVN